MTQLVDDLEGVRECLVQGWCQGVLACDDEGYRRYLDGEHATQFCLTGAVARMVPPGPRGLSTDMALRRQTENLSAFNDTHTKAEVIALVDRAIEAAQ